MEAPRHGMAAATAGHQRSEACVVQGSSSPLGMTGTIVHTGVGKWTAGKP